MADLAPAPKSYIKPKHELADIPIKGAHLLRKHISINDSEYRRIWGPNTSRPRDYYLYGILSECEKAGLSMMQHAEFAEESRQNFDPDEAAKEQRLANNIIQGHVDELTLWQRKMTEMLIDLIGFRRANSADYYTHYLVVRELTERRKAHEDFRQFYNCNNQNLSDQITDLKQQSDLLYAKLDPKKCWYFNHKKYSYSDFKKKFTSVFSQMTVAQKAVMRTYGLSFGMQSEVLHPGGPSSLGPSGVLTLDDIDSGVKKVGVLALHVIVAAKDLMHLHNVKGFLKGLAESAKKNELPGKIHKKKTKPPIEVGDYVVAYGDLAQVVKVNISRPFGYRSFRVKYLETPPMPNIKEDEFTPDYVHLVYKRSTIAAQLKADIAKETPNDIPSTRLINNSITETVIDLWNNLGLKEQVFGNPNAAREKIRKYLASQSYSSGSANKLSDK